MSRLSAFRYRVSTCVALSCVAAAAIWPTSSNGAEAVGVVSSATTTDPDDTHGRLDISRVRDRVTQRDRDHVVVSFSVQTFTPFSERLLEADQRDFVLELNRDSEPGSERNITITGVGGELVADVISNATREVIATVQADSVDDHTIRVTGPRRLIGARSYFWTSNFHLDGSVSCGDLDGIPLTCQDSVPDEGWIRLDPPAWPPTRQPRPGSVGLSAVD
jgi:hypothetical protein